MRARPRPGRPDPHQAAPRDPGPHIVTGPYGIMAVVEAANPGTIIEGILPNVLGGPRVEGTTKKLPPGWGRKGVGDAGGRGLISRAGGWPRGTNWKLRSTRGTGRPLTQLPGIVAGSAFWRDMRWGRARWDPAP